MSTGISISSINRIKELAEEKKFEEALEILDTQNLEKSINPQFLRISGEIFRENKRYYDSRRILLKAHQMSPQGLRILAELIQLYLELGYFSRAQRYYEQYQFYTTPEDNQKEYVEYIMKKGTGADVKELASILIPILERLPEDRWNFEAVLLYDKMGRKDKALDESRYILENFKESIYVEPAIAYIEDKLDVNAWFFVYPKQEKEEDEELFGDLIEEEEKLLEADHLRMYPPEAKIMVEAEDKELIDIKPAKEKKPKKKKKAVSEEAVSDKEEGAVEKKPSRKKKTKTGQDDAGENQQEADSDGVNSSAGLENSDEVSEEEKRKEREAALEKLLSKKISTEQIKESAKQAAQVVKEIDTGKAKEQVKSVAQSVKGNVKKATDVIGEAVGVKTTEDGDKPAKQQTEIVDGIIESVLEPPKKAVGQVVTNEELDALIPESLEAMSMSEIAELEAKKLEAERLELEALEAQLKLEEEKKAKSRMRRSVPDLDSDVVYNLDDTDNRMISVSNEEFSQLKKRFLDSMVEEEEEAPLDSLGYIKVVQSDVDEKMEREIPDAAGILHQMIDNREFYAGEDSTRFESKASYENHGFEIEDYAFDDFENAVNDKPTHAQLYDNALNQDEDIPTVEIIYAQEDVIEFSEMVPEAELNLGAVPQEEAIADPAEKMPEEDEQQTETDMFVSRTDAVVRQENEWEEHIIESEVQWQASEPVAEEAESYVVEEPEKVEEYVTPEALETESYTEPELVGVEAEGYTVEEPEKAEEYVTPEALEAESYTEPESVGVEAESYTVEEPERVEEYVTPEAVEAEVETYTEPELVGVEAESYAVEEPEKVEEYVAPEAIEAEVETYTEPEPVVVETESYTAVEPESVGVEAESYTVEEPERVEEYVTPEAIEAEAETYTEPEPVGVEAESYTVEEPERVEEYVTPEMVEAEVETYTEPELVGVEAESYAVEEPEKVEEYVAPEAIEAEVETYIEPEPVTLEAESYTAVEPEKIEEYVAPEAIEAEAETYTEPEPVEVEAESYTAAEPEQVEEYVTPEAIEAEAETYTEPEPIAVEVESYTAAEPEKVEEYIAPEAVETEPEPIAVETESRAEEPMEKRRMLRVRIVITEDMTRKLMDLKESR